VVGRKFILFNHEITQNITKKIRGNSCQFVDKNSAGVALRFTPAYIVSSRWDGFYVNIFLDHQ
ncbi:MAG: hypothetical protein LBT09_12270, partial [Planctomycetaceae bacterium]|jgi:hypothetical protein|nr:hypothetical protein [Planctomycetaceae bacterium]